MSLITPSSEELPKKKELVYKYFVSRAEEDEYKLPRSEVTSLVPRMIAEYVVDKLDANRDSLRNGSEAHIAEYYDSSPEEQMRKVERFIEEHVLIGNARTTIGAQQVIELNNNDSNNEHSVGSGESNYSDNTFGGSKKSHTLRRGRKGRKVRKSKKYTKTTKSKKSKRSKSSMKKRSIKVKKSSKSKKSKK